MAKKTAAAGISSERDWEVEDALRTILRAEEIKKDAKMMKRVEALAVRKQEEMKTAGIIGKKRAMR